MSPNSLQTLVVKKGPQGSDMQFKYDSRNNSSLVSVLLLQVALAD